MFPPFTRSTNGELRPAFTITIATVALGFLSGPAHAENTTNLDSGNTAWMLVATTLVLLMLIPGLALFYGGMVRKKNVLSMVMHSMTAACLLSIVWMVAGYSLAFSDGGSANMFIGGLSKVFLTGLDKQSLIGTIPESLFMVFQMTFALITPALITGAFADRMKFSTLVVFLAVWSLLVYAPVCHWVWGGGFLANDGVLDFAGGTVVHINSGIAALVGCLVLGPRTGYPHEPMQPHNLVLSLIGAAMLWAGWFGFNGGSALAADETAAMVIVTTQIAAAAGGMAWLLVEWAIHKKPSVLGIISGAIAGLVAITPACAFVTPSGALLIGLIAGIGCFFAATTLKRALKYDDSLDVFGIHGMGGIIGAILTGVFASEAMGGTAGMLEGNSGQVLTQIWGVAATIIWSGGITYVLLRILDATMGLRVSKQSEIEGLDLNEHGEVVQ